MLKSTQIRYYVLFKHSDLFKRNAIFMVSWPSLWPGPTSRPYSWGHQYSNFNKLIKLTAYIYICREEKLLIYLRQLAITLSTEAEDRGLHRVHLVLAGGGECDNFYLYLHHFLARDFAVCHDHNSIWKLFLSFNT